MPQFQGVALVTGAASGIGAAVALALVRANCTRLILADISLTRLSDVVKACHAAATEEIQVLPLHCDVRDPPSVDLMVEEGVRRFGEVHYCVNCAGILPAQKLSTETSFREFREAIEVNQRGIWLSMRAELRQMMRQKQDPQQQESIKSSIVNVSSNHGLGAESGFSSYAAASHGILGMTRSTAMDYIHSGIRINCVHPGPTDTPGLDASGSKEKYIENVPLKRVNTPDEVAAAIVFLLSPGASGINGVALPVDSGWSLCHR